MSSVEQTCIGQAFGAKHAYPKRASPEVRVRSAVPRARDSNARPEPMPRARCLPGVRVPDRVPGVHASACPEGVPEVRDPSARLECLSLGACLDRVTRVQAPPPDRRNVRPTCLRSYLGADGEICENPKFARGANFRAIVACPWVDFGHLVLKSANFRPELSKLGRVEPRLP